MMWAFFNCYKYTLLIHTYYIRNTNIRKPIMFCLKIIQKKLVLGVGGYSFLNHKTLYNNIKKKKIKIKINSKRDQELH